MAALDSIAGGYACQFVESVPKELQIECSICLHTVRDPHMVDCCGYRFCKTCIDPLKPTKKCPLCNCRFTTVIPDKLLQRTLKQKRVYCTHKASGCEWTGELAVLDKHLNAKPGSESNKCMEGCPIQKVKCRHTFCNDEIQRYQLESHESSCPKRVVICGYCNVYKAMYRKVVEHWNTCGDVPVDCPNDGCEIKVKRNNVSDHMERECPHTIVPCEFAYAGCKASVPRHAMSHHLTTTAKEHVDLLASHCMAQKKQLETLQSELQELKVENAALDESRNECADKNVDLSLKNELLKELADLRGEYYYNSDCEVLVSNLADDTEEHMIKSLFGQHGKINRIEFYPYNNMAVVEYVSEYSIYNLFAYQKSLAKGLRLRGSTLNCMCLSY